MMKKIFILLAVMVVAGNMEAKVRVGVKGGLNFSSFSADYISFSNRTGWHAGAMMNISFPFGLTLQPELLYSFKGVNNVSLIGLYDGGHPNPRKGISIGYVELPVDLQWGIKLPLLRPYLSLTPYASYAINSDTSIDDIKKWDGGIGVGAGIDIWKLQLSVKYFWGFGNVTESFGSPSVQNRNIMVSLGIFL
jgi:hypothetical protein